MLCCADLRHRIGGKIEQDVDVARHEVAHRGPEAPIRHEPELGAGDLLESDGAYMRGAADTGRAGSRLVWIGFQPGDHLPRFAAGRSFLTAMICGSKAISEIGIEILHNIVFEWICGPVEDVRRDGPEISV